MFFCLQKLRAEGAAAAIVAVEQCCLVKVAVMCSFWSNNSNNSNRAAVKAATEATPTTETTAAVEQQLKQQWL